ncbi:ATP-dependent Clp protease ATP-binding subunit [Myroides sp. mNGS23_01]|nr:ATP-dependent Clp protease ATP-binding subunit [Myroides sp. mNGS23_01]WHT40769.1 ATP-dependent Clp protease ATP-binding subunit [Myroides sp. mNGS23_01]
MLDECKWQGGMLVIDEIHKFVDSKGNFSGLANLLIPNLTKGDITVIGTTTVEEYRKLIEPEGSFNRRFEKLEVQEPDEETCVKMLESSVQNYTIYHGIQVEPEALVTCVALAKRYAKEKKLPDTAFDLLDQTMAAVKLLDEQAIATLIDWKIDYDKSLSKNFVDDEAKCKEIVWLFTQLQHRISPILLGLLTEQPQLELYMGSEVLQFIIGLVYDELVANAEHKITSVSKVELTAVMAAKTGIPIGKIQVQEKEKLLALEELLGHRVVGQQHALKVVSDAIIESRSGLNKPGQPIGSFFFLGPTGTGKTELAKAIASLLFNDEKAMIRFDMSEFKEEHSAALLYGAPPGYIGYEEGGMLVNKIRQQPYAVVLFDEIEKAHPSVFDVFLQLMDEGKIHDKLGKVGDFSNALILFTSNIGSEEISAAFGAHRIPTSKELMQWMTGCFRPEFLARITEIVPFAPITEEMAEQIFTIQLKVLMTGLHHLQIAFEITDVALKKLAIAGFTAEYGARQINSVIRQQIARPISKMLVREELVAGQKIRVDWQNDAVVFQVTDEE